MTHSHQSQENSAGLIMPYTNKLKENAELQRQIDEHLANGGKIKDCTPPPTKAKSAKPKKGVVDTIRCAVELLKAGGISHDAYIALNPSMPINKCIKEIRTRYGYQITRTENECNVVYQLSKKQNKRVYGVAK